MKLTADIYHRNPLARCIDVKDEPDMTVDKADGWEHVATYKGEAEKDMTAPPAFLERVYTLTNSVEAAWTDQTRPDLEIHTEKARSTSVGDLICIRGEHEASGVYVVRSVGFREVPPKYIPDECDVDKDPAAPLEAAIMRAGRHCGRECIQQAGTAPVNGATECILPDEPQVGDWECLQSTVRNRTGRAPTEDERTAFVAAWEAGARNAIRERLDRCRYAPEVVEAMRGHPVAGLALGA